VVELCSDFQEWPRFSAKKKRGSSQEDIFMTQSSSLILAANTSDARLLGIVRDLSRELSRIGIKAEEIHGPTAAGERGDPLVLAQLALGLVTSGAVTALIDCLKAYIGRESTLIVRLKRQDGAEVEVAAKNVADPAWERALREVLQST
jgi:hypothetical protein